MTKELLILPALLFLASSLCISCGTRNQQGISNTTTKESTVEATKIVSKPIYNVYVENSASMYGYVEGVTDFEQSVYNYLSDMKIHDLADSMHLYYINSKPILYGSHLSDFIEKLSPSSFRTKGGARGTTDISNVLKMVLDKSGDNSVNFLISDFIFSPGKNKDAEQYLINQQIGIKNNISDYLKKSPDHAVLVYHLDSEFSGYYYDKNNKGTLYNGKRPFYIWIIGHKQHLAELMVKCPESKMIGSGVKNTFSIVSGVSSIKYAVVQGSGNFRLNRKDHLHSIINAQKDTRGSGIKKMRFSINADLSDLICSDEYLTDPNNYKLNDADFDIEVVKLKNNKQFTHQLKLSSDIVKHTQLKISIKSQIPLWVEDVTDNDGVGITDNNAHQTFGFKYLIGGIYEAFTKDSEEYVTLVININK